MYPQLPEQHDHPDQPSRPQISLFSLAAIIAGIAVTLAVLRLDWMPLGGKIIFCVYGLMGLVTIVLLARLILDWNREE